MHKISTEQFPNLLQKDIKKEEGWNLQRITRLFSFIFRSIILILIYKPVPIPNRTSAHHRLG